MTSQTPVSILPFIGPKYVQLLDKLGIKTVGDLLYHIPRGYQDLSKITTIADLEDDALQVIEARVDTIKKVRIRGGKIMVTAKVFDDTGKITLTWFNNPYVEQSVKAGLRYRFAGEPEQKYNTRQILNPTSESADKPPLNTGRLVPVYNQTAGITSKWLRARLAPLMSKTGEIMPEFLPSSTIADHQLLDLGQTLRYIHQPEDMDQANLAKQRLAFEEMLLLQLYNQANRLQWQSQTQALSLAITDQQFAHFIDSIPFALTDDQLHVATEIRTQLSQTIPMNRLVQGDVGSGKTVVAYLAALQAVANGHQVALLAPTSVLAQQHYQTFQALLESAQLNSTNPVARRPSPVALALRTSKSKMPPADITIGTHALLSESVALDRLALVIVDEQHRFGVEQRAHLLNKAKHGVHVLTMTATPIPRTLALTAFGDLDVSTITTKPANRLPIKTHIVPQAKRQDMYPYISQAISRGEQVYIICPLVEESETLTEVKSATAEFERLKTIFPQHRLALLHGRMKPTEKDTVLGDFKKHLYDILVATPVVEVGIDVANATILVVEGAERFGLAQLHQLRGRVGRGDQQSFCFLLSDAKDATEISRLQHLTHYDSGIQLAEIDLQERGPGEVYGTRQSGIPTLKAASFFDLDLIQKTQSEAQKLLASGELDHNPVLRERLTKLATPSN